MTEMRTNSLIEAIRVLAAACPDGLVMHCRQDRSRPGEVVH